MSVTPPKHYLSQKNRYPELFQAFESLGETLKQQGPIEAKTAHLIQLAAAATLRSEGAVHSHTRRALDAGAGSDEIRHALLLLTTTIGFPGVMAAMDWADDIIEE